MATNSTVGRIRAWAERTHDRIYREPLRSRVYDSLVGLVVGSSRIASLSRSVVSWKDTLSRSYYSFRYDAPVDNTRLIEVDPNAISTKRDSDAKKQIRWRGAVQSGDWDGNTRGLDEYDLYSSLVDHFEEGTPWPETELWQRVKENCESNPDWNKWGCEDFRAFEDRLRRLDDLYEFMESEGYLSQSEILYSSDDPMRDYESGSYPLPLEYNEITVLIGRDGELILHDGRHRLAIASVLDVESVPVRVKVRHREWQEFRDEVYRGEAAGIDHPDLDDW